MARKTKAELAAEREELAAMREAEEFAQYQNRLMVTLERATSAPNYYELTVRNGMTRFVLQKNRSVYELPLVHSAKAQQDMDDMNMTMDFTEQAVYEANKRAAATAVALAKLTAEERELLDL